MPNPSEAPGSSYEKPLPEPSEDRGLADMLSREIPRGLPKTLAELIDKLEMLAQSRDTI
jgi:hypothetical protein